MLLLLRDATIARYMYPIIHINPTHSSKRRRLGGYISPPPASAKESTSLCTHLLIDRETNSLLCEMRSSTLVGITPIGGNGWTLREEYPLVQSRCNYSVVDTYTIAEVIQDYYSNAPINRDVEYVFPLPPSAAVCSFKAIVDDTQIIKGVVKEKVEAKKAYDKAVAQGKTAGLLRQEHADVFRVSLGNIRPKTKISVHISFVSIVPHDGSSPQTLRITMPTAIAPRYGTAPTDIPWFGNNVQSRFELSV
ncbi:hypothetical protein FRB91_010548 [Serendipita sp. 411]|nr:hypothetical protein FRB91_010548 [Serendipita sp. 411]